MQTDQTDKAFKPFPNKPWFLRVCSTSLLKTLWKKEKLLVTSNFSFSHSVFYLFEELSAIFNKIEIVVCKPISIWTSLIFVVWERVKKRPNYTNNVANPADTVIQLQRQLNAIKSFCENTWMQVNIYIKKKLWYFVKGGPLKASEHWTFDGEEINIAPFYKYMGLLFTPKLSWSRAQR